MIKKIEENKMVLDFTNEGNNYLTNNSTSKAIAKANITNDEITLNIEEVERNIKMKYSKLENEDTYNKIIDIVLSKDELVMKIGDEEIKLQFVEVIDNRNK